MSPLYFDFPTWLDDYNQQHNTTYKTLPIEALSEQSARKRQAWVVLIGDEAQLAPFDLVPYQEGSLPRSEWMKVMASVFSEKQHWADNGEYGQQVALKPQASEQIARWQYTWEMQLPGPRYSHAALLAIVKAEAFKQLKASYLGLLEELAQLTLMAQYQRFAKALREAVLKVLKTVQVREAALKETLLQRLECLQATEFKDACLLSKQIRDLQAIGVDWINPLPNSGYPLTPEAVEAFYGFLNSEQDATIKQRLSALGWETGVIELVWFKRDDGLGFFVPRNLVDDIPANLSFWDKSFPGLCKGAWARWQLFEHQSSCLIQLNQLNKACHTYQFHFGDKAKLLSFSEQYERAQAQIASNLTRLAQAPFSGLSWVFQYRTKNLIQKWSNQLKEIRQVLHEKYVTVFCDTTEALLNRATLNALLEHEKQSLSTQLLSFSHHCLTLIESGEIKDDKLVTRFKKNAYATTLLLEKNIDEHPVKVFKPPAPSQEAPIDSKGTTIKDDKVAKSVTQKFEFVAELQSIEQLMILLKQGESLPRQSLAYLEDVLAQASNRPAFEQALREKWDETLRTFLTEVLTELSVPDYSREVSKQTQICQRIITLTALFKSLGMQSAVRQCQAKLPGYFFKHLERLLAVQVEKRHDASKAMPALLIQHAPGYTEVESVIAYLSTNTHYNEFTMAQWVESLQTTRANEEWGLHITGVQDAYAGLQVRQFIEDYQHWLLEFNQTSGEWLAKQTLAPDQQQLHDALNHTILKPDRKLKRSDKALWSGAALAANTDRQLQVLCLGFSVNRKLGYLKKQRDIKLGRIKREFADFQQDYQQWKEAVGLEAPKHKSPRRQRRRIGR